MPYDEKLEARILSVIAAARWGNIGSKKMFGGVCHVSNGNMFCGVYKNFLILRLGEAAGEKALSLPHVKPFDITGRPMKGWVMVEAAGVTTGRSLLRWLESAREFADTLPKR